MKKNYYTFESKETMDYVWKGIEKLGTVVSKYDIFAYAILVYSDGSSKEDQLCKLFSKENLEA